ncbi:uncharacterized protein LOC144178879 isoform X3 [Haemaphysalis longicornis]
MLENRGPDRVAARQVNPDWHLEPPATKRRAVGPMVPPPFAAPAQLGTSSPWGAEHAPRGLPRLLPRTFLAPEEHNRFREMELFLRSTPQPLAMHSLGGLCSQFVPRIKTEPPEPSGSPLRRPNADNCSGGHLLLNNSDDNGPLDVRIHPRSPNGGGARSSASVGGTQMVDNGEVEEIVASVELADDSTGDISEDRNNIDAAPPPPGRGPYASARAVAERQLVELQRLHAEEEHKLKVELLKKQHAVADLQRKYWRMKVKVLAQRAFHGDNKSVEEDESDSAD